MCLCCSFYCAENSSPMETVQTERRHQIQVPLLSSTTSRNQAPSPKHPGTLGDDVVEYEERTRTWPRKRSSGRHRSQPAAVDDSNDPATLASNHEQLHNDCGRLASRHNCKSADAVFTSHSTDELQYCNADVPSTAAETAEELLGSSIARRRRSIEDPISPRHQYSVTSQPSGLHQSRQQQSTAPVQRLHDTYVPFGYPYVGSCVSPYDDGRGHRSPAAGIVLPAIDSRRAVDVLFEHLGQDPSSTTGARPIHASPHLPSHSPYTATHSYCLSNVNDHHSQLVDLSATEHGGPHGHRHHR